MTEHLDTCPAEAGANGGQEPVSNPNDPGDLLAHVQRRLAALEQCQKWQAAENEILERLAAPFDPEEIKCKPAVVSGNRALAMWYVDARVIQDRLDDVLGPQHWKDEYEVYPDCVVCKLSVRLGPGSEWLTKTDVGGLSEQPDDGDKRKAAFSDALKRAAVKYGIGRFLYRLPPTWLDYDPQKRQFAKLPRLPAETIARACGFDGYKTSRTGSPMVTVPDTSQSPQDAPKSTKPAQVASNPAGPLKPPQKPQNGNRLPKSRQEYLSLLEARDAELAAKRLHVPGAMTRYITEHAQRIGLSMAADGPEWTVGEMTMATNWAVYYVQQANAGRAALIALAGYQAALDGKPEEDPRHPSGPHAEPAKVTETPPKIDPKTVAEAKAAEAALPGLENAPAVPAGKRRPGGKKSA